MPNRKAPLAVPSLGRGQAARPAGSSVTREGERVLPGAMSVPIEQLAADPDQPRRDHGAESLTELGTSLTDYGVLQPLLVREAGTLDDGRTRYMIVAGGRRYAAALLAGLTRLPVVVKETEGAALRMTQLVENIQRQDLAPLEEARAFQELMDAEGLNAERLAAHLHISGQHVRTRLLLLSDQVVADAVAREQIAPSTAREVLRLPDDARAELRDRIAAGETLAGADVQTVRARQAAAGVVNPRAKGGGRPARVTGQKPSAPTTGGATPPASAPVNYQPLVDPAPPVAPRDDPDTKPPTAFETALARLDGDALATVLDHGVTRGWNCQDLREAVQRARHHALP